MKKAQSVNAPRTSHPEWLVQAAIAAAAKGVAAPARRGTNRLPLPHGPVREQAAIEAAAKATVVAARRGANRLARPARG
ncbi:MAG: hypothetical protein CMO30_25565 [Tistrella sp.]|nr:hypothetical protein [Tistrella sp.]